MTCAELWMAAGVAAGVGAVMIVSSVLAVRYFGRGDE